MKNNLTKEEKIQLLKNFLGDEVYFKAMQSTFTEQELNRYIDKNLDTLIIKSEQVKEK